MRYALLFLSALSALAPQAAMAQSMDTRRIVADVTTEICGPFMETGDMEAALQAALAQGYRPVGWNGAGDFDPAEAPSRVVLDGSGRHIGILTLAKERRGVCAIDMAQAGVAGIVEAAREPVTSLGLTLAYDAAEHRPAIAVWTGEGRLAVAQPGTMSSGHVLIFSWSLPPGR